MHLNLPAWPPDWEELQSAVIQSMRSGDWGRYQSSQREALRSALAQRFAQSHVRLCSSGTVAIELALRASGIGPGDEVILAAYDYPGNLRCIELVGATPVLIDTAADGVHLDPAQLNEVASDRVRALIASHLYGQPAPVVELKQECERRGWLLIEDACQVPGLRVDGTPAGGWGAIATLSFGGSKTLTAGCGGALLTSNQRISARLGPLADRPSDAYPLGPLQAAVLLPQLARLEQLNAKRAATVRFLLEHAAQACPQWEPIESTQRLGSAHYKMAFRVKDQSQRQRVITQANDLGLPIGPGFRCFAGVSKRRCRKPTELPNSKRLSETVILLDHTALMLDSSDQPELLRRLTKLHKATA